MDSPNKFDWLPPGTTQAQIEKQRYGALKARHEQIMKAVRKWNDKAAEAGYEGVDAALNSLIAMKRGPRPIGSPPNGTGEL